MNVQPLTKSDIEWADIVFLSAMIVQRESLDQVVKLSKELGKRVAVGGPYVSTSSDLVPEADFIFVGEAETTLPEFIDDLKCSSPKRIYQATERPSLLSRIATLCRIVSSSIFSPCNWLIISAIKSTLTGVADVKIMTSICCSININYPNQFISLKKAFVFSKSSCNGLS